MNKVFYHWGTAANTLQIFKMSSHKEKWNIEVTLRFAFSHFMEVLLYTLKWLEFEIYKVIFVVSSVLEIINQKKKILSPWFLEFWQLLATPLTRFCLEVETNLKKKKSYIYSSMDTVFLGTPRNERAANACKLSQAKKRIWILTVNEKSNHGAEFMNDWEAE